MSGSFRRFRVVVAAVAALLLLGGLSVVAVAPASADNTTASVDSLRTGWDANEPGLSPSSVQAADFGQIFSSSVDGAIYGQPLVIGSTVVVTTEHASAYGFDATTGALKWRRHFGTPFAASSVNCADITPEIGSTSTPVADGNGYVYLTTKLADGSDATHPHWYMQAVSVTTGAERPGWPVQIQGSPSNDPANPFLPFTEMQRPGLLLLDGVVYAAFGAHCDTAPYRGYVVGVSTSTAAVRAMWTTESGVGSEGAGIWQSGGGIMSDGSGRLFVATGNGLSPPVGPGHSPPGVLAESVIRLGIGAGGALSAQDFFSPSNAPNLDALDKDLGSGGPMGIPDGYGTAAHPHLMVTVGKDGRIFLLDRDDLGGRSQGPGGSDDVLSVAGPYTGVWGHPAFLGGAGGSGGYVYSVENSGYLRALSLGVSGTGIPQLSSVGTSSATFGSTSGSPVVTSDGTTPGSGVVWVVYSTGPTGAGGQLRAYGAQPSGGVLPLLWSAPIGTASRYSVPATNAGRVYVGTLDGKLIAFGRPATAALVTSPLDFGSTPVGQPVQATAVATAATDITVTGVTTSSPFDIDSPIAPTQLAAGQKISVPLTFTPTGPGDATGQLTFSTSLGVYPADLHGRGTAEGLLATPASLDFGTVPTGQLNPTQAVAISNSGTAPLTITSVTPPSAPFSASGLPSVGSSLAPGASVTIPITYNAATPGTQSGAFAMGSDAGPVTVPLTGTAVIGQSQLSIGPATVDWGSQLVKTSATLGFDVANTGNLPLTITKAKGPTGAFAAPDPLPEGLTIGPGEVVHQDVIFRPTRTGPWTGSYLVVGDDGTGDHIVTLTGRGSKKITVPVPKSRTWQFNGAVTTTSAGLQLTKAGPNLRASAFSKTPLSPSGLTASFQVQLTGGSGGEGLAFVLADATKSTPRALGAGAAGLGWAGIPGFAIVFDTVSQAGEPATPLVGIPLSGSSAGLQYAAASPLPSLRTGWHTVTITVTNKPSIRVSIDGANVIGVRIPSGLTPLPAKVYAGFTASTSRLTDRHVVRDVKITALSY